jgi:uncharacterized membrane protein (UPF0127 family)
VAGTTEDAARRLRRLKRALLTLFLVAAAIAGCRAAARTDRVQVLLDGKTLTCDVADTEARRQLGLQTYRELPEGRGMLFVNDAPRPVSIGIKRLAFPIDVAFVDSDMRVVKTASLDPQAAREVSTSVPSLYVIETPGGWLESNGVGVGSTLGFPGRHP